MVSYDDGNDDTYDDENAAAAAADDGDDNDDDDDNDDCVIITLISTGTLLESFFMAGFLKTMVIYQSSIIIGAYGHSYIWPYVGVVGSSPGKRCHNLHRYHQHNYYRYHQHNYYRYHQHNYYSYHHLSFPRLSRCIWFIRCLSGVRLIQPYVRKNMACC